MPRATCRCGQLLEFTDEQSGRVTCPKCGARVRIRRAGSPGQIQDGFLRFYCPCGRRLKVDAENPPTHGKCPDCGRVVPVPESSQAPPAGHPETPTEELAPEDLAALERWSRGHLGRETAEEKAPTATTDIMTRPILPPEADRAEVGLRVCPGCGRPVHLGAEACRVCGTVVPRR